MFNVLNFAILCGCFQFCQTVPGDATWGACSQSCNGGIQTMMKNSTVIERACNTFSCYEKFCVHDGKNYKNGQNFYDECNRCTCRNGTAICSKFGCLGCLYKGKKYKVGQTFKENNNTCTCGSDEVSCTSELCPGLGNVALGKNASQSSNYYSDRYFASTGVDGEVKNNNMLSGTCFHTKSEFEPWWRVDLQANYYISSVVIHNRLDCCAERAKNIHLSIGKTLDSMREEGFYLELFDKAVHTFTVNPPAVGRYVKLRLRRITDHFHLCEVQVNSCYSADTNVALNKNATMSSSYGPATWLAPVGVDGNIGNYSTDSQSCFHTDYDKEPWWRVDLGGDFEIFRVIIYNRLNMYASRARNIRLTTGTNLASMTESGYLEGTFVAPTHVFTIDPWLITRYVQLKLIGITEYFHLCEVEVYGR